MHKLKNNFETTLSQDISTIDQLTIQLTTDPLLTYPYWLTIGNDSKNAEIVEVTGGGPDFPINRAQQDTTAQIFTVGTKVRMFDTAGHWDEVYNEITQPKDANSSILDNTVPSSKLKTTNDADKIKLVNLSTEVQEAMTGTTSLVPPDDSVTMGRINSALKIRQSINLFNLATATSGYQLDNTNGNLVVAGTKSTSDFIPVQEFMQYKKTSVAERFCWYDINQTYISGGITGGTLTAPVNAKFIKISMNTSVVANEMFVTYFDSLTPYVAYNTNYITVSQIYPNLNDYLETKNTFNLFNKTKMEFGRSFSITDGTVQALYNTSEKITVKPGYYYTYCKGDEIATTWTFFDTNDVFISGSSAILIKAPENASYVRVKINSPTDANTAMILESTHRYPDYIPYQEVYLKTKQTQGLYKSKWYNKNWLVVGDSIGTGDGRQGTYATQPYHYLLSRERQIKVIQHTTSGVAMTTTVTNWVPNFPPTENAPDLITIMIGTNDHGYSQAIGTIGDSTRGTFYGSYKCFLDDLITRFPKASIGLITPPMRNGGGIDGKTVRGGGTLKDFGTAIKNIGALYSIPVFDMYDNGGFTPYNTYHLNNLYCTADGTHPNNDGHKILAGKIGQFIETL